MERRATLEELLAAHAVEIAARPPGQVELEVRARGLDAEAFREILRRLAAGAPAAAPGRAAPELVGGSNSASVLVEPAGARRPGETLVWRVDYVDRALLAPPDAAPPPARAEPGGWAPDPRTLRYITKTPLSRAPGDRAAPYQYTVALSAEVPRARFPLPNTALVRLRARATFAMAPWRIDASAVLQAAGGAGALPGREELFGRPDAGGWDEAVARAAGVPGAVPELELEYAPAWGPCAARAPPGGWPATPRPADVAAAAAAVLSLAGSDAVRAAAYQADVARLAAVIDPAAAAHYTARAPGGIRRGLRGVLPQAIALTRRAYRAIYPPTGWYFGAKADGTRAVLIVRDAADPGAAGATCVLLATSRTEYPLRAPPGRGEGEANLRASPARAEDSGASRHEVKSEATAVGQTGHLADGEQAAVGGQGEQAADGRLGCALDCELLEDGRVLAFDVITAPGSPRAHALPFRERVGLIAGAVAAVRARFDIPLAAKPWHRVDGATPAAVRAAVDAASADPGAGGYPSDGLVLTPPGDAYDATEALKWKDAAHATIDFLVRAEPGAPPPARAEAGPWRYLLFCSSGPAQLAALGIEQSEACRRLFPAAGPQVPIQFAPADAPRAYLAALPRGGLDGRAVELRVPAGGPAPDGAVAWELVRVRADKQADLDTGRYFGNSLRVAEDTWQVAHSGFGRAELWDGPASAYFAEASPAAYAAERRFTNRAKDRLIALACSARGGAGPADTALDLAAGRGGDLGRYQRAGIRRLFAVDADRDALAELVARRYESRGARSAAPGTAVFVLLADLAQPWRATAGALARLGLPPGGADAAVCNLALHYFTGSAAAAANLAALAAHALRPGGRFAAVLMAGERVLAALAGREAWEVRDDPAAAPKYAIRRKFADERLADFGQRVAVRLPFAAGEMVDEFLVNCEAVARVLEAAGLAVDRQPNGLAYRPLLDSLGPAQAGGEAPAASPGLGPSSLGPAQVGPAQVGGAQVGGAQVGGAQVDGLTPADVEYLSLFGEITAVRTATPPPADQPAAQPADQSAAPPPAPPATQPALQPAAQMPATPPAGAAPAGAAPPRQRKPRVRRG
jgi:SAM-dependent methyltransferase